MWLGCFIGLIHSPYGRETIDFGLRRWAARAHAPRVYHELPQQYRDDPSDSPQMTKFVPAELSVKPK